MPDRFGPRGVFAVMIPRQNSNMQPEYQAMCPPGVSNQMYRFDVSNQEEVPEALIREVEHTLGCWPDMVICGNAVEMRDWSIAKHAEYHRQIAEKIPGIPFVTATDACTAALRTIGAKRLGVLSPMTPELAKSATDFYEELGFEVPYSTWLKADESIDIINISREAVDAAFDRLDHEGVDTFLHIGGALGILDRIDDLEKRLGRPVISICACTYWYALRKHGITDPFNLGGKITRMQLPEEFAYTGLAGELASCSA
ncbi:MAG: maleate cis-trans isomerase family protein [Rhizobiaceae bacterium]